MDESPPRRSKHHLQQRTTARREQSDPPPTETIREAPQLCPEHKQEVHFCCFDCEAVVCCAKCIAVGRHRAHDIKNLHRSYVLVEANLSEMLVRLAARVDLYSLSHEKLSVGRSELVEDYTEARSKVQREFRHVQEMLTLRCSEITDGIQLQCKAKEEQLNRVLTEVRQQIKLCMDSHAVISQSIKEMSEVALCSYYSVAKLHVEELLRLPLEDRMPQRVQISLQLDRLTQLADMVQQLKVPCISITQRKRNLNIRGSVDLHKRIAAPYSPPAQRNPRDSVPLAPALSPQHACETLPRPKSRELLLLYNSRRSPKMFSMPGSPPNEQSPLHQFLQIQKKSFNLGRKHC